MLEPVPDTSGRFDSLPASLCNALMEVEDSNRGIPMKNRRLMYETLADKLPFGSAKAFKVW